MWTLRAALPKRSPWRRAQFDTLRLTLVKIAARVVEMKTRIAIHLPSACPAAPRDAPAARAAAAHDPDLTTTPAAAPARPQPQTRKPEGQNRAAIASAPRSMNVPGSAGRTTPIRVVSEAVVHDPG